MDTRTTRESLNELAVDAGKLGIEGSKNILDFVDAGNQINVALSEDLGADARVVRAAAGHAGGLRDVFPAGDHQTRNVIETANVAHADSIDDHGAEQPRVVLVAPDAVDDRRRHGLVRLDVVTDVLLESHHCRAVRQLGLGQQSEG